MSLHQYVEQAGVKLHRMYLWSSRRKDVSQARDTAGLFARVEVAEPAPHRPLGTQRLHLPQVYLRRGPVDFRKGMRSLAVLVEQKLRFDPFAERVYVFTNRRRTAAKCLAWEHNGFCLWPKQLEAERFKAILDRPERQWIGRELEQKAQGYAIAQVVSEQLAQVKGSKL